jgi:hypothetical protein
VERLSQLINPYIADRVVADAVVRVDIIRGQSSASNVNRLAMIPRPCDVAKQRENNPYPVRGLDLLEGGQTRVGVERLSQLFNPYIADQVIADAVCVWHESQAT